MADANVEMLDEEGLKQAPSEESIEEVIMKRKRGGVLDGLNMEDPDSYLRQEPLVEKAIALAQESRLFNFLNQLRR
jgi:hypothetical protein